MEEISTGASNDVKQANSVSMADYVNDAEIVSENSIPFPVCQQNEMWQDVQVEK